MHRRYESSNRYLAPKRVLVLLSVFALLVLIPPRLLLFLLFVVICYITVVKVFLNGGRFVRFWKCKIKKRRNSSETWRYYHCDIVEFGTLCRKFEDIRSKLENARITNKIRVIQLGCKTDSESSFRPLPQVSVEHILAYYYNENLTDRAVSIAGPNRDDEDQYNIERQEGAHVDSRTKVGRRVESVPLDKVMDSLYTAGKKHTILLIEYYFWASIQANRNQRKVLLQFRDYVRKHYDNWDIEYKKGNKGTRVYLVNAIYTVPSV